MEIRDTVAFAFTTFKIPQLIKTTADKISKIV
jgi:hypothetical protein